MAMSALTLSASTPKLSTHTNQSFHAKPTFRCDLLCSEKSKNDIPSLETTNEKKKKKKNWAMEVGFVGLLAASMVAVSAPLEAEATRIEYYATVGEPSCDMSFVRSGLGFCDLLPGSGQEAPYSELINVCSLFLFLFFLI